MVIYIASSFIKFFNLKRSEILISPIGLLWPLRIGSAPALSVANSMTILSRCFNCMDAEGAQCQFLLRMVCGRGNQVTHTRRVQKRLRRLYKSFSASKSLLHVQRDLEPHNSYPRSDLNRNPIGDIPGADSLDQATHSCLTSNVLMRKSHLCSASFHVWPMKMASRQSMCLAAAWPVGAHTANAIRCLALVPCISSLHVIWTLSVAKH